MTSSTDVDALIRDLIAQTPVVSGFWEATEVLKKDPTVVAFAKRSPDVRLAVAMRLWTTAEQWPRRSATVSYLVKRLLQRNKALTVQACLAFLGARSDAPDRSWTWQDVEDYVIERFIKEARVHGAGDEGVAFATRWLEERGHIQMSPRPSPLKIGLQAIVAQGPDAPTPGPPEPLKSAMVAFLALPGGLDFAELAASVGKRTKPTKSWEKKARAALDGPLAEALRDGLAGWLEAVDVRPELPVDLVEPIKGLLWASAFVADEATVPTIVAHVQRCFVKISGVGARHPTLGTAGIRALGFAPEGLGADGLFALQRTLRYPSAQSTVERVLDELMQRTGLDRRGLALRSPTGHPVSAEYAETWTHPIAEWRAWFAEHPDREDDTQEALWWLDDGGSRLVSVDDEGALTDLDGAIVTPSPAARLQLWHPAETDDAFLARATARVVALDLPREQVERPLHRPDSRAARGDRQLHGVLVNAWPFERAARARGWSFSLGAMYGGEHRAIRGVGDWSAELHLDIPDDDDNESTAAFPPWNYMKVVELRFGNSKLGDVPPRVFSEALLAATELVEASRRR